MTERNLTDIASDFPDGFRMTPQRVAILDEIRQAGGHLTASEIIAKVHEKHPSISIGTVYRTLHILL